MKKLIFIGFFTFFTSIYSSVSVAADCDHCTISVCGCHLDSSGNCKANDENTSCSVDPYDSCEKCSTYCAMEIECT